MTSLVLLLVCLALGVLVARFARPPAGLAQALNWWVIQVALPAMVLDLIPRVRFERQFWFLTAANWIVFAGAALLFAGLGKALGWSRGRIGALTLVGGLGNTAFMGYPMIEALRGAPGLSLAVIGDQTGCFTALVLGGVAVTAIYAGRELQPAALLRQILRFPPFLALLAGVLLGLAGDPFSLPHAICARIAATLSPLALFSVGLQQRLRLPRRLLPVIGCGVIWKLLLAPAICLLVGRSSGVSGLVLVVGVLQTAMPPMISAAVLAGQYELEPELANAVLGIAILLSLISVPYLNTLL
ncbi:MAG TPA: AEC family transporter [Steroidobacteraceae bacterium]